MAGKDNRYEFRTFGQNLDKLISPCYELPEASEAKLSKEIYFLTRDNSKYNIKIRNHTLDVKKLLSIQCRYELWTPHCTKELPIDKLWANKHLADFLNFISFNIAKDSLASEKEVVQELSAYKEVFIIYVDKVRKRIVDDEVFIEWSEVFFNGARLESICIESYNLDSLKKIDDKLNLGSFENLNYVRAIKKIIGIDRCPLPAFREA